MRTIDVADMTKSDAMRDILTAFLRGEGVRSENHAAAPCAAVEDGRVLLGLPGVLDVPPTRVAQADGLYEAAEEAWYVLVHAEYPPDIRCRHCGEIDPNPWTDYDAKADDARIDCVDCGQTDTLCDMRGLAPAPSPKTRDRGKLFAAQINPE